MTSFVISPSPHIFVKSSTRNVMWAVNFALLPALAASVLIFGWRSLAVICVSVAAALLSEVLAKVTLKRKIRLADGSAVVTGILFAFTLPPTVPLWMPALGMFTGVFIVKQLFGGLGFNIFNPALAARAVLAVSFPGEMFSWSLPVKNFAAADAVSSASPLGFLKEAALMGKSVTLPQTYLDMFVGWIPGSLGETCKAALLLGFLFLLIVRIIDWRIPVTYIGSVALLSWVVGKDPLFEILAGGLFLGAFFMATDLVTSPVTRIGRLIFGTGCGLIVFLIRNFSNSPEGVCYSILFMNCLTPLIDRNLVLRRFGVIKKRREAA